MRIAVAGGTGVVGRHVVRAAQQAGHDVVSLSRGSGVDLTVGAGLEAALAGSTVIIDAANIATQSRTKATEFFTQVTAHLQRAGSACGVTRLIVLSIVGIDRVPYGYYRAKVAHEVAALEGPLPATIVRATQFHEFAAQVLLRAGIGPVAPVPSMRVQPIAARTVGELLVEVATDAGTEERMEIAGPEVRELPELARSTLHRLGRRTRVVPIPVPGKVGKAMRTGGQLPGEDARIAGPPFDDWLAGEDVLEVVQ